MMTLGSSKRNFTIQKYERNSDISSRIAPASSLSLCSCDEEGHVILDRNPRAFGALLNFLRSGVLPSEEAAQVELFYEVPTAYGLIIILST